MTVTAKLINPSPFKVEIPYEKGVSINIEPDGEVDLTTQQFDDYKAGRPGSEEARSVLNFHGVFLMDTDRSYDVQALEALQASIKEKKSRYGDFVGRTRDSRVREGAAVDDATLEEIITRSGYARLREQVEKLEKRIDTLKQTVQDDPTKGSLRARLDPKRTCFVIDPPRQFPSETALKMFLDENPDIKKRHEELVEANKGE